MLSLFFKRLLVCSAFGFLRNMAKFTKIFFPHSLSAWLLSVRRGRGEDKKDDKDEGAWS